jgi:hypothetical protein
MLGEHPFEGEGGPLPDVEECRLSTSSSSSAPPTKAQLLALTHLPAGMAGTRGSAGCGGRGKSSEKAVRMLHGLACVMKLFTDSIPPPAPRLNKGDRQEFLAVLSQDTFVAVTSGGSLAAAGILFNLGNFDRYTEYTSLFDDYKIEEIEVRLTLVTASGSVAAEGFQFASCIDRDDAAAPTSFPQVVAHQNSFETTGVKGHYYRFVPYMATAAYSGAFTSYTSIPPVWLDCASPSVSHYGIKLIIQASSSPVVSVYVDTRARVRFGRAGI